MRLVQLQGPQGRKIAVVEEPNLRLVEGFFTIYDLALASIGAGTKIGEFLAGRLSSATLDYAPIYDNRSDWKLLPSADHPLEPARCLVSGTGLTHMASAKNRQAMHGKPEDLTDSMRMYRWGVEGGRPESGKIGTSPEWFYKGCGTILRGHGSPLTVPSYAEDGGEEPEVAGVYVNDSAGHPYRIGLTVGNEFSDHEFERRNYLYLASSKLRECAIGPELVIGEAFDEVPGEVTILRGSKTLWSKPIRTGEKAMSHSLANIEHHHFKFEGHRRPGDVHVHFFGADAFSFGEGVKLQSGDVMQVGFEGFGRPLRNSVQVRQEADSVLAVTILS
ncbi:MAG TPA: AraD1 family protein [Bryobacteraceae bacterium]